MYIYICTYIYMHTFVYMYTYIHARNEPKHSIYT